MAEYSKLTDEETMSIHSIQSLDNALREVIEDLVDSLDELRKDAECSDMLDGEKARYIEIEDDKLACVRAMYLRGWDCAGYQNKLAQDVYREHGLKVLISGYMVDQFPLKEILRNLDDNSIMVLKDPIFRLSVAVELVDDFDPVEDEEYPFDVPGHLNKFLAITE